MSQSNLKYLDVEKELELFKHKTFGTVKFAEVDMFRVVHNIQYFYWLEHARSEYLKDLGLLNLSGTFTLENPLMLVHADIDYFNSASFADEYEIFTRITLIKNSSLNYDNIIKLINGKILIKASAVHTYFDLAKRTPLRIPDEVREIVKSFEGDRVQVIDN